MCGGFAGPVRVVFMKAQAMMAASPRMLESVRA